MKIKQNVYDLIIHDQRVTFYQESSAIAGFEIKEVDERVGDDILRIYGGEIK